MKKQLHHLLIDYFLEIIPRIKQEGFDRQRQTDGVVVWIAGISTGAIALIISQGSALEGINSGWINTSLVCFLLSVLSGVTFRAFIYILQDIDSDLLFGFEGYCVGASLDVSGPQKNIENYTIEDIAKSLKEDMGLDYDDWLEKKYLDLEFWTELYNSWAEFWGKSEEDGLRSLGRAIAPLYGKEASETEELFLSQQEDIGKKVAKKNACSIACKYSYILLLVFFGLAILVLALGFLFV